MSWDVVIKSDRSECIYRTNKGCHNRENKTSDLISDGHMKLIIAECKEEVCPIKVEEVVKGE